MIESKLKQIASDENGKYSKKEYTRVSTDGSRCPEIKHRILLTYHDCDIEIFINTGFLHTASVICNLSSYIRPIEFKINSLSPFINLFLRKKSRFKVKCNNDNFKYFLENKALIIFDDVMRTKNFDPSIFSDNTESINQIKMEFHIAFPDWINIFKKIISFYKIIIEELESDNRFISNNLYRENNSKD